MATRRPPDVRWPWDPVALEVHEISAIKAVAASHPIAFDVIVEKLCRTDQVSFAAGGEDGRRASDYAEGKRAVGLNLRAIRDMKLPEPRQRETGPHAVPKGEPPST